MRTIRNRGIWSKDIMDEELFVKRSSLKLLTHMEYFIGAKQ